MATDAFFFLPSVERVAFLYIMTVARRSIRDVKMRPDSTSGIVVMVKINMISRVALGALVACAIACAGCNGDKPELEYSEYGETLDHLPIIEDLPVAFPISDEIEDKECKFRREAEGRAQSQLYNSQGRSEEYEELMKQRLREEREQSEREHEERMKFATQQEAQPAEEPAPEAQPAEEPAPEAQPAEEPAPEAQPAEEPAPEAQPAEEPAKE